MEQTIEYLKCFVKGAREDVLLSRFERHNDMLAALMNQNNLKLPDGCCMHELKSSVSHITDNLDEYIRLPLDGYFDPADYVDKLESLLIGAIKKEIDNYVDYL